jgi:hypothetical protein
MINSKLRKQRNKSRLFDELYLISIAHSHSALVPILITE